MRSLLFRKAHKPLKLTAASLTGAAGLLGGVEKANVEKTREFLGQTTAEMVRSAQEWNWVLVPFFIALAALIGFATRWIGDPKKWNVVHDVLDQLRDEIFSEAADDVAHEHRVTLFKKKNFLLCKRGWWWSGWLVPVERSGHTSQKTDVYFKAPDNAALAEGVAGQTWARKGKPVYVRDLPNLGGTPTDAELAEYAKKSFMALDEVRNRRPLARSLYGFAVEANGQRWGVIVVDSRLPRLKERELSKRYRMVARFLGKTLEAL